MTLRRLFVYILFGTLTYIIANFIAWTAGDATKMDVAILHMVMFLYLVHSTQDAEF